MAQSPKVFQPGIQLGLAATVLYTQPANSVGQVLRAVAYNSDTVARQITLYRVPAAGSPGPTNLIIGGQSGRLAAGQSLVINAFAGLTLNAGETLQGLCDAAAVINVFISGYDNT